MADVLDARIDEVGTLLAGAQARQATLARALEKLGQLIGEGQALIG